MDEDEEQAARQEKARPIRKDLYIESKEIGEMTER